MSINLNQQQKITAIALGVFFLLLIAATVFVPPDPGTRPGSAGLSHPIPSTITATPESGWWDAMPTKPVIPTMPGGTITPTLDGTATATATATSTSTSTR